MMPTQATPRIVRAQRTALSILILSGTVNYLDRATLAVANPLIREDLGLNIAQRTPPAPNEVIV